jgi:hypothetical protein
MNASEQSRALPNTTVTILPPTKRPFVHRIPPKGLRKLERFAPGVA